MKKELTYSRARFILLLFFFGMIIISGCRKDKKNPIGFEINAYQPHTNEPVSGIKWKVVERKYKGLGTGHEATGWTMEGETDINGMARAEFPPKKNSDYSYIITFDYSAMDLANGEYSVTKGPTDYALLKRTSSNGNSFEVRILPKLSTQFNFKNLNCFDASDTFKYKSYNCDELNTLAQGSINGWPWLEGPSLNGCVDYTGPFANRLAGNYVFIWEATRNGILETGIDTFYVEQGVNSTINMNW